MSMSGGEARPEPAIRIPWPVALLLVLLIGAHAARLALGVPPEAMALTGPDLAAGRWGGLLTHLFVHINWLHVVMNSVAILAFGAPVARFFGTNLRGAVVFGLFFLVCGVIAGAGQAAISGALANAGLGTNDYALVGASGAASGLIGAAMRLIQGRGRPGPLFGRTVVLGSAAWILVNVVTGVTGLVPGLPAGVPIGWQDHLVGYFAGLILIPMFARLAGSHEVLTQ